MTCRWVGADGPRLINGRHEDDCAGDCAGCQPCDQAHCRVQAKPYETDDEPCMVHAASVCPACVGRVRGHIREIVRLCRQLADEVEIRGVNSEAMALLGPVADPESWGHHKASAVSGRIVPVGTDAKDAAEVAAHYDERDVSPLWVLGTWQMLAEESYGGPSDQRVTVTGAADWLDDKLHWLAADLEFPFEELARDVTDCRRHLEQVLRAGEQVETTRVTCDRDACRRRPRLVRRWGKQAAEDSWHCPACGYIYDEHAYRAAHAQQLRHAGAQKFMPLHEAIATLGSQGRSEHTVRAWLKPGKDHERVVQGYCDLTTRQRLVWWPDLWTLHCGTKTRMRSAA